MGHLSFGIDISDDLLTGVAVAGKGKEAKVASCAYLRLDGENGLTEQLPLLLDALQWEKKGACDIGLSLSEISLRNIILPFADTKKIEQILPFELDEQLMLPFDEQVIATSPSIVDKEEGETHLLTAALDKDTLLEYLALFHAQGLEPDHISPTDFVLGERLSQSDQEAENFLLLSCDLSASTVTVIHQGAVVFMRHLAYPAEVFTEALFSFDGQEIHTDNPDKAEQVVNQICADIQQSVDFFKHQFSLSLQPAYILLTGPMLLGQGFEEKIAAELELPVKKSDLIQAETATLSATIAGQWKPELFDRPLALALQASFRKKTTSLNFRKNEFAPPHYLLRSKKQLTGAAIAVGALFLISLSYLFFDARHLQNTYDELSTDMVDVFQESFPGITPSGDPLLHMRSKLQGMDTVSVSMPIFNEKKRVLFTLYDISSRIPATLDIHVTRLIVDQGSVKISGTTDAFNNVNTIKNMLTASERYAEVSIVSATKGTEKEGIRFEIKLQLTSAKGEQS
ncbi:MAG: PilN domain-containing protein [Candidatus Electrothrix aestuarii]|uniref:PilN domain-containing protein n=1 Tax=Candidatus Electrothrix aestuarii TaxID=3062594 RepID=A0AAU8LSR2_9BACT|nr:PilN domain-containing protein [Candidatus Electrothrix aestuarii]